MIDLAKKVDFNMKTFNYLHSSNYFFMYDSKLANNITIKGEELIKKYNGKNKS